MTSPVIVYTFEDADGQAYGSFDTQDYEEANDYANDHHLVIVANEFKWAGSEVMDDCTIMVDCHGIDDDGEACQESESEYEARQDGWVEDGDVWYCPKHAPNLGRIEAALQQAGMLPPDPDDLPFE